MSDPFASPEPSPIRPRRRRWPYIVLLSLPVLVGIGLCIYLSVAGERELRAALAETERLDPRWRLEDVEADRAVIPDAENSGGPAMAAKHLLPQKWPFWDYSPTAQDPPDSEQKRRDLEEGFRDLEPQRQLNEEQATALRREMSRAAAALAEARKLVDLTEGRYPIAYSPDFISTLIPHTQDARLIANLLAYDAVLRAQAGDADGALSSCRGVLNAGRSVGDEPFLISQLVRIACRAIAVDRAQRVLAQGESSEEALRQLQQLLEKEELEPLLLIAARGERAGQDRLMEAIQAGKIKLSARDLAILAGLSGDPGSGATLCESLLLRIPGSTKFQRSAMLRCMNRIVALAKLPPHERHAEFQQMEMTRGAQPVLVRLLVPALGKVSDSCQRCDAQLRCALVAVAAERYRRAQGRWPDKLGALKEAGYLQAVPADPYDGQPLRWRRLGDGQVVYSIGPDGEDNGGKMDRQNPTSPGTDIGFRLWDAAKRRQPPATFKPAAGPGDAGKPPGGADRRGK
jgi:hypothetical protein